MSSVIVELKLIEDSCYRAESSQEHFGSVSYLEGDAVKRYWNFTDLQGKVFADWFVKKLKQASYVKDYVRTLEVFTQDMCPDDSPNFHVKVLAGTGENQFIAGEMEKTVYGSPISFTSTDGNNLFVNHRTDLLVASVLRSFSSSLHLYYKRRRY